MIPWRAESPAEESKMKARVVLAGSILLALRATTAAAQDGAAAGYTVEVNRVVVDVIVLDRDGRPIEGLRREDFALEDEGEPQDILDVTEERHEVIAPDAAPAPAGAAAASPTGRLIVLLFDAVKLTAHGASRAKAAASQMVKEGLGEGDRVAIMRLGTSVDVVQPPTADRGRLLAVLAPESGGAGRDGASPMDESQVSKPAELDSDRRLFGVLDALGRSLKPHAGRKLLFLLSDVGALGVPLTSTEQTPGLRRRQDQMIDRTRRYGDLVESLNSSNIAVYTVSHLNGARSMADASDPDLRDALADDLEKSETARTMAASTGGLSLAASADLGARLAQASRTALHSYLISFEPREARGKGLRDVKVRVKREGARVLARKSYAPPVAFRSMDAAARRRHLEDAMISWFDLDGLPFDMKATVAREGKRARIDVVARMPAALVTLGSEGRSLDLLRVLSHDDAARKVERREETIEIASKDGEALFRESIDVKPGVYTLRIVVRDAATGTVGSRSVLLTIPEEGGR